MRVAAARGLVQEFKQRSLLCFQAKCFTQVDYKSFSFKEDRVCCKQIQVKILNRYHCNSLLDSPEMMARYRDNICTQPIKQLKLSRKYEKVFWNLMSDYCNDIDTAWWGLRLIEKKNVPPKRTTFLTTYVYEVLVGMLRKIRFSDYPLHKIFKN